MATMFYANPELSDVRSPQPDMPRKRSWDSDKVQHVVKKMVTNAKHAVEPRQAAKRFLYDVVEIVEKTYPVWEKRLEEFLEDTSLDFEVKRTLTEVNPVRHMYFAVVVGMEAAKIRTLFPTEVAEDLLAEINELIDKIAGRTDHMVSDLVFDIVQRVQVCEVDDATKAHDVAMKRLADLLYLSTMEETKELCTDIVFRQEMGQPLAVSMRHWWKAFKGSRQLAQVVPAPTARTTEPRDHAQTFKIATVH